MKQPFLKDIAGTIRVTIYQDNRPIVPTSAQITLYKPGGEVLQSIVDVTAINSNTGEMTYSLTATHTAEADLNYKAVWAYVYGGVTYYESQLFDVVKSILSIPIIDTDLYAELDSLRKANNQSKGTVASATASTIVDTTNRKEDNDFWTGGVLEILAGTGSGQVRDISDYVKSTSTITVTPDFVTTPDTTSTYRIVKSFAGKIKQSFEKIEDMLYSKGKRQDLILESSQIKFPLIYLTIHAICLDLFDETDDKWDKLSQTYLKKFQDAFDNLVLEYDSDESGFIDGSDEAAHKPTEVRIGRC
jgi:hypothetical protein